MSERVRQMLVYGIAAAKGNSQEEARSYFRRVLDSPDVDRDQLCSALLWLSRLSDYPSERRNYLEEALNCDPTDPEARRELAILNGKLDPADIVDPDHLPASTPSSSPQSAPTRRFVCSSCGGKMTFTPDGNALTCAYCGNHQSLADLSCNGVLLEERDFSAALAMAKGHTKPATMRSIKCSGCGAAFVLSPQTISITCPYCASAYAVEQTEARELIEPEGVVPFVVTQDEALKKELEWFRRQKLSLRGKPVPPVGAYLPVWTFDISGEITWNCLVEVNDTWVPRSGSHLAYENDLLVPASQSLSAALNKELANFPLDRLATYDVRYLADFPAETYQIPVSDASLVARSRVVAKARSAIDVDISETHKDLNWSTRGLVVESYKLILVPMWIAHYRMEQKQYTIAINGQTGLLQAEKPLKGVRKWFSELLSL